MKTKNILFPLITLIVLLFSPDSTDAQKAKPVTDTKTATKMEVIQFHSEHRCKTCNTIESLTRETLKAYPGISFSLVNVDDKKNEKKAVMFEAFGTALFLYDPKTGKKKDLTDFAFLNAGNKSKFILGLKKEIDAFGK